VARDIFSIILHGIGVEARFFLGQDVIGWRQSNTTGKNLCKKLVVRQFARANHRTLTGTDPELDTMNRENDSERKEEVEERKFPRMAKVYHVLGKWQGSYNLRSTQKESRVQNKQMTTIEYILDTAEIVKASWSFFDHDAAPSFKL
jgi:phosphate starvation-inducible protein PhoH